MRIALRMLVFATTATGLVPVGADEAAFGTVLAVEPAFAMVKVTTPRRHCWRIQIPPVAADTPAEGRVVRRCAPVSAVELREEQVGYRVKYRYRGRTGEVMTRQHPGERIQVRYPLRPVYF